MELSPARLWCTTQRSYLKQGYTWRLRPLELSAASPELTAGHSAWKGIHQRTTFPPSSPIPAMLLVWLARQSDTDLTFHIPLHLFTSAASFSESVFPWKHFLGNICALFLPLISIACRTMSGLGKLEIIISRPVWFQKMEQPLILVNTITTNVTRKCYGRISWACCKLSTSLLLPPRQCWDLKCFSKWMWWTSAKKYYQALMLLTPLAPGFWYLHCSVNFCTLYLHVSHYHSKLPYHALSPINE